MKTAANTTYRTISLALVSVAIALSSTALFTNHWFDQLSISLAVVYNRGLWVECSLLLVDQSNLTSLNILSNQSLLDSTPLGFINTAEKRSFCQEIAEERKTSQRLFHRFYVLL